MADPDNTALPFTGERFTPECVREIWYEHWHRYAFALDLARGKRVLDAACGEGYGSALLAGVAAEVVGLDIDAASIAHARSRYRDVPRLGFEACDVTRLDDAYSGFDLVVSFETLEHVSAQDDLIAGFARALADDGVLLVSSPDRHTYTEVSGFRNEYHVRELERGELVDLLGRHFPSVRLFGQKLLFQSVLWSLDTGRQGFRTLTAASDSGLPEAGLAYAPLYYVAVCSKRADAASLPALSLFGDREESVYAHYNHEVRKNMNAGVRIAELEAEIERLRAAGAKAACPPPRRRWWRSKRSEE